jgi:heat-inducible transcriptional repressor
MKSVAYIGEPLDQRQRHVLFVAIGEYIRSGRPVSSRSIAARPALSLSPASIRRTLHELTLAGLLMQPHTSAGRVPTEPAFRMFVDALRASASEVERGARTRLVDGFRDLLPGETESWRETVRVLSELSTQTALVITPAISDSVLQRLRFIRLEGSKLLAVVVTREGLVHNAHLECGARVGERELERIHNYLEELIVGRSLNEIRRLLREELEDARARRDALRERATLLGEQAVSASLDTASELLVEGRTRLLEQPELKDRLREIMAALEEKARILDLLDQAAETDGGPLVIIGSEGGAGFEGCALVTAPFRHGASEGQIGVIGSIRMDYPAMLPLVNLSARLLSFDDSEDQGGD